MISVSLVRRIAAVVSVVSSVALATSCTGRIGSTLSLNGVDDPNALGGKDGLGGGDGPGDGNGPGGAGGVTSGKAAVAMPLSRMTAVQYSNTLKDLFSPIAVPEQATPADALVESFGNNTSAQTPSVALIEAYHTAAVAVSTAAMQSSAQLLGCSPTAPADEDACAKTFFASFTKRAYRRPPTTDELTKLSDFYTSIRSDGTNFATAMTLSIQAILQSPGFLYRVEIGVPIEGKSNVVKLLPHELASRLSYLLWNTMPDAALLEAADAGDLDSASGIEKQARRLLDDPRAHEAVLSFYGQWLRFDKMKSLNKDPAMFPDFTPATAASLKASAERTVDEVFFGSGSFDELLTDDRAWVDDEIADIFGVSKPGKELKQVQVDAKQRSGILTHPGLMAAFAHETAESPVLRGVFVLNSIMCTTMPSPPPNVNVATPAPDADKPLTTRQRFEMQHEQGSCATCHHTIDGIGFAFGNYDAIGAWRTKDFGLPVDATGWFNDDADDLSGEFDGAIELGAKLANSESVHTCVAATWLRYALGVDHTGIDSKSITPLADAFVKSDLNMRELVIALTTSDAFTTRLIAP